MSDVSPNPLPQTPPPTPDGQITPAPLVPQPEQPPQYPQQQPAPTTPPKRQNWLMALAYIAIVIAGYIISSFVGGLLAFVVYIIANQTVSGGEAWLTNSTTGQFTYSLITYGLFLAFVVFIFKALGIKFSDIKLGKPKWSDLPFAIATLFVYYAAYLVSLIAVSTLVPGFNSNQQQQIGFDNAHGIGSLTLVYISICVIPPLVEEILTRGYLYTGLKKSLPKWLAVVLTSMVFAVGHLEFGSGQALVWVAALFTFILSFALIYLREKTGRLWAGIFLHALVNSISFVALFVIGGK